MSTMFEISILTFYGLDKKQAHAHAVTATANLCFTVAVQHVRSIFYIPNKLKTKLPGIINWVIKK